jgi:polar amino acid transport system substrate-binding protein
MELDIFHNMQKYVFAAPYFGWLMAGVRNTIIISLLTAFFAFILGVFVSALRNSENIILRTSGRLYINIFRNMPIIPLLLLLVIALPSTFKDLTGVPFPRNSEFFFFITVISLNTSAYIAEILRSGMRSIPGELLDCAKTLGLSSMQIKRKIIFPQIIKICMPSLKNRFVHNLQNTAFAIVIPISMNMMDVLGQAKRIEAQNFATVSPYLFAGAVYISLAIGLSFLLQGCYRFYMHYHGGDG